MKTHLLLVALLVAGMTPVAPAFAGDSHDFDAAYYLAQLHYAGINALEVDDYSGNRLRALVRLANGLEVVEFFDKDTMQRVR